MPLQLCSFIEKLLAWKHFAMTHGYPDFSCQLQHTLQLHFHSASASYFSSRWKLHLEVPLVKNHASRENINVTSTPNFSGSLGWALHCLGGKKL